LSAMVEGGGQAAHLAALKVHYAAQAAVMEAAVEAAESSCGWLLLAPPRVAGSAQVSRTTGGFFVWIRLPSGMDGAALVRFSEAEHGVTALSGDRCFPGTGATGGENDCIRLSFSYLAPADLEEGVRRLAAAVSAMAAQ